VGVFYDDFSYDDTTFLFALSPAANVSVETAETALDKEIARLLEGGVSAEEVARSRDRMIASAVYAADSLYEVGRIFGTALTAGLTVDDVEDWPTRLEEVSAEEVNTAARRILRPEGSVTGLLLPADER
jgi:zinc protease